jgi:repressor LexA
MLTPRQSEALQFIGAYQRAHAGVTPSYIEITTHLGLKSLSGVARLIAGLEERGFIRRFPGRARAIEILKAGDACDLPTDAPPYVAAAKRWLEQHGFQLLITRTQTAPTAPTDPQTAAA